MANSQLSKWFGIFLLFHAVLVSSSAFAKDFIPVILGVSEALEISNSTSSERFRSALEAAVYYGLGENEAAFNRCGYRLMIQKEYFESSNLQSATAAGRALSQRGAWVIFGPRRSEHVLALASGASDTAIISPMAETVGLREKAPSAFSMYANSRELATAALHTALREKYGTDFGAIIDARCLACQEFESEFTQLAQAKRLVRQFGIDVYGDQPDLAPLFAALAKQPIHFLLVPNYSMLSGHIIAAVAHKYPHMRFIGANGWGDGQYGFLLQHPIPPHTEGFCVRVGALSNQVARRMDVHSLDYQWQDQQMGPSFTALSAIALIRQLAKDVCAYHPTGRQEYVQKLHSLDAAHFRFQQPLGSYRLKGKTLKFSNFVQ